MEYESRMGSPRKYYRWFRGKTHAQLNYWYKPEASIEPRFALIPMVVDGSWTWLTFYFALKTISSAFSFGGTTTVSYKVSARSKSIFGLKKELKKSGAIKNLYREKIEARERFDAWTENFKKVFRKHFKNL